MDAVRLALVNLYKASSKEAHQSRFFLYFFYNLFNSRNPIYHLSTAGKRTEQNKAIIIPAGVFRNCCTLSFSKFSKHLQATGKQPVHVELSALGCNSGCTAFLAYFLSNLENFAILDVKAAFLVSFYFAFEALYNPQRFEAISAEFLRLRKTRALRSGLK